MIWTLVIHKIATYTELSTIYTFDDMMRLHAALSYQQEIERLETKTE